MKLDDLGFASINEMPQATIAIGVEALPVSVFIGDDLSLFDVVELDAKGDSGIKNVRDFCASLFLSPRYGAIRLGIVQSAHLLTQLAQNSLLKVLEEPPSRVKIVLVARYEADILPTVLSRGQKRYLEPESEITASVFEKDPLAGFKLADALAKDENLPDIVESWLRSGYETWKTAGRPSEKLQSVVKFWDFYQLLRTNASKRLLIEQLVLLSVQ